MDPITAIIGAIGIGTSLFGMGGQYETMQKESGLASQEAGVSKEILGLQEQENEQRRLAMGIAFRRQQTETVRRVQQTQAMSLAAGVNQGAQFSSGVQGGQSQAASEGAYNLQGLTQNFQIGNQLFDIQNTISGKQMTMADLQSQMAKLQGTQAIFGGLSSLGGSIAGSAGNLGSIFTQLFKLGQGV